MQWKLFFVVFTAYWTYLWTQLCPITDTKDAELSGRTPVLYMVCRAANEFRPVYHATVEPFVRREVVPHLLAADKAVGASAAFATVKTKVVELDRDHQLLEKAATALETLIATAQRTWAQLEPKVHRFSRVAWTHTLFYWKIFEAQASYYLEAFWAWLSHTDGYRKVSHQVKTLRNTKHGAQLADFTHDVKAAFINQEFPKWMNYVDEKTDEEKKGLRQMIQGLIDGIQVQFGAKPGKEATPVDDAPIAEPVDEVPPAAVVDEIDELADVEAEAEAADAEPQELDYDEEPITSRVTSTIYETVGDHDATASVEADPEEIIDADGANANQVITVTEVVTPTVTIRTGDDGTATVLTVVTPTVKVKPGTDGTVTVVEVVTPTVTVDADDSVDIVDLSLDVSPERLMVEQLLLYFGSRVNSTLELATNSLEADMKPHIDELLDEVKPKVSKELQNLQSGVMKRYKELNDMISDINKDYERMLDSNSHVDGDVTRQDYRNKLQEAYDEGDIGGQAVAQLLNPAHEKILRQYFKLLQETIDVLDLFADSTVGDLNRQLTSALEVALQNGSEDVDLWDAWKRFHKIKEEIFAYRDWLYDVATEYKTSKSRSAAVVGIELWLEYVSSIDFHILALLGDNDHYLQLMRAKGNVAFQLRESFQEQLQEEALKREQEEAEEAERAEEEAKREAEAAQREAEEAAEREAKQQVEVEEAEEKEEEVEEGDNEVEDAEEDAEENAEVYQAQPAEEVIDVVDVVEELEVEDVAEPAVEENEPVVNEEEPEVEDEAAEEETDEEVVVEEQQEQVYEEAPIAEEQVVGDFEEDDDPDA